jgi:prevent-host-death family protein
MRLHNITDAKSHFSELIAEVQQGEEIVIGKAGQPVAKLIPFSLPKIKRKPGALKGKIKISDDFDELPEDIAAAFGMSL